MTSSELPSEQHENMVQCYHDDTYAVMVHKLYSERVQNSLLSLECGLPWTFLPDGTGSHDASPPLVIPLQPDRSAVQILDTPLLTGVSQARRGYVLLLVNGGPNVMSDASSLSARFRRLPAMARQNISWVGRITHSMTLPMDASSTTTDQSPTEQSIGSVIWNTSLHGRPNQETNLLLRVDCHPRDMIPDVCRQLQRAAAAVATTLDDTATDPFDGPIPMTMSRSKCTHRLTVIALPQLAPSKRRAGAPPTDSIHGDASATTALTLYYWGLEDRSIEHDSTVMQLKLNHEAAEDVIVVPADATGRDVSPDIAVTTPLSRAYYKLHQVWEDYVSTDPCWTTMQRHGIDLGASPGGWTQVLVHCFGCTKVVAVDAGIVAQRALTPCRSDSDGPTDKQVVQLQSSMEHADLTVHQPYTVLVCDASLGWSPLLDLMVTTASKCTWTLPAVVVITLKMPFKTAGSIHRHIQDMHQKLPVFLRDLQRGMFESTMRIRTRYQLVHLMANADSERTVIAIFEPNS